MIVPDLFKTVMRRHAAGVVVISLCVDERTHFMTATSFTPVSMDPPLVLFCVHRKSDTHGLLSVGDRFGVSLLSHNQEALSRRFSSKGRDRYAIDDVELVGRPSGIPLLADSSALLEAEILNRHDGGDHSIFIGKIIWAAAAAEVPPLVYHSGQYLSFRNSREPVTA